MAIIDIGSNSVRLVVYSGAGRIPSVIFNEKVMAGLGLGVARSGALDPSDQERALVALRRFRLLTDQMKVSRTRTVATAAVRDASNGEAFLDRVRAAGLEPEILSGEEEARMAGLGVLSGIPAATGIVGDLGGGSLELIEVGEGRTGRRASLPLGVLRLEEYGAGGEGALRAGVADAIAQAGFAEAARGRPFYLVGGSWRALARLDLHLLHHPLPIMHQHRMAPERAIELKRVLRSMDRQSLRTIVGLPASRIPTLPGAARMLIALVKALRPSELIVSSFGIREGLLYADLDPEVRHLDPLVEATREAGAGVGRFAQHGDLLDRWIDPVFDDPPEEARLRLAACLLADTAWSAHPDFRSERGVDMALHGHWVGIDAAGRALVAQALFTNFGGGRELPYPQISALSSPARLRRATTWGLAIRLGQRLSGGVAAGLGLSELRREGKSLHLDLRPGAEDLAGESVRRRLGALAAALSLEPVIGGSGLGS